MEYTLAPHPMASGHRQFQKDERQQTRASKRRLGQPLACTQAVVLLTLAGVGRGKVVDHTEEEYLWFVSCRLRRWFLTQRGPFNLEQSAAPETSSRSTSTHS
eukprot:3658218-Pyramimonas_sp.AAC.1